VIMMSGSVLAPWALQPSPELNARALAKEVGCFQNDAEDILDCLRVI